MGPGSADTPRAAGVPLYRPRHGARSSGRSADRALSILQLLEERRAPVSAMGIAITCRIPRSTAYSLLGILQDRGFVEYRSSSRSWSLCTWVTQQDTEPSLTEAIAVMNAFLDGPDHRSLVEIAHRAKVPLVRASAAAEVLAHAGWVSRGDDGQLRIAGTLLALAAQHGPVGRLRAASRPILADLRDRTGETANLLVRDGLHAVYVDQVQSTRPHGHRGWEGRIVPLETSAAGAALRTRRGAVIAVNAIENGVTAVACAVPRPMSPAAAISVTGPSVRLRGTVLRRARAAVEAAAHEIADALQG